MAIQPGQKFDRYAVEELVGEGGMGRVYRAFDTRLERSVALKVLNPADGDTADSVALALREARAAAAITHPNATAIYDAHEVEGTSFIAMEFVAGRLLRVLLAGPPIPQATKLRWLIDIAGALEAAHQMGVVHRDVKPENVMVRHDGLVKVLDFGVARRSVLADGDRALPQTPGGALAADASGASGASGPRIAGTPAYMAPEQIRGEEIDGRADQFGWGVLGYELLTGRLPWRTARNVLGYIAAVVSEEPAPPSELCFGIPREVDGAVLRALSKSPADRFPSMRAAAVPLLRFARGSLSMMAVQLPTADGSYAVAPDPDTSAHDPASDPTVLLSDLDQAELVEMSRPHSSPPAPAVEPPVALGTLVSENVRPRPASASALSAVAARTAPAASAEAAPQSSGRVPQSSGRVPQSSGARARAGATGAPRRRRPFGLGFHEPDFDCPVDLDAHLALIPPGATVKGLFFADLLLQASKVTAERDVFRLAQLPPQRYVSFRDYPLGDSLRITVAAARVLYPRYTHGEALRRVGQTVFDAVLATHLGRALFGVLGRDVEPVLLTVPKAYQILINIGKVTAEKSGFRTFTFHAHELPTFLETYHVGVLEGLLRHCGERGRIRIAVESLARATIELCLL